MTDDVRVVSNQQPVEQSVVGWSLVVPPGLVTGSSACVPAASFDGDSLASAVVGRKRN